MSDHKPSTPRDLYQEATDRIIKALESGFTLGRNLGKM